MFDKIGLTTWNTHENGWLQKIYINKSGKPVYTYHYQSKSSKPSITIEIDTRLSRHYCAYILIEKDLEDILGYIDLLLELINTKQSKNDLLIKGLSRAIVATYGKCFTQADGRKIKLSVEIIPIGLKEAHDKLMDMRNNYVAHAGVSQHETCRGILVLPPESKARKLGIVSLTYFSELRQTLTSQILIHKATRQLIEHILTTAKQKIIKLCSQLHKETDKLNLEKVYRLVKNKNSNRIVVNDESIRSIYTK